MICEKCWSRAQAQMTGDTVAAYNNLLASSDCTPEEQAGPDASECPHCNRKTVGQSHHICVICGYRVIDPHNWNKS